MLNIITHTKENLLLWNKPTNSSSNLVNILSLTHNIALHSAEWLSPCSWCGQTGETLSERQRTPMGTEPMVIDDDYTKHSTSQTAKGEWSCIEDHLSVVLCELL